MPGCFITASGTEIGKTLVTCTLARQFLAKGRDVRVLKPVMSGYDKANPAESDAGRLLASIGRDASVEAVAEVAPWRFAAPLSPDMAAAREGRTIDFDALVDFCRAEIARAEADDAVLLIEGIGGTMVPLTEDRTVLDWIAALHLPTLLVTGSYLGSISHTLTALSALMAHGPGATGVVISESGNNPAPAEETAAVIGRFVHPVPVRLLPRLSPDDPDYWTDAPDLTPLAT